MNQTALWVVGGDDGYFALRTTEFIIKVDQPQTIINNNGSIQWTDALEGLEGIHSDEMLNFIFRNYYLKTIARHLKSVNLYINLFCNSVPAIPLKLNSCGSIIRATKNGTNHVNK